MEFIRTKRDRKRKWKRRSINGKQRRDLIKFAVISAKRQKQKLIYGTMEANAFWENYKAAHEWQNRHNITWWKTRCFALEHENCMLKETIRYLVQNQNKHQNNTGTSKFHQEDKHNLNDNMEFHLNEDMMNFLAQSIQHKIELKNKKQYQETTIEIDNKENEIEGGLAIIKKRNNDAKLLYGEASSRVIAMETALQTTTERHVDKAKPQYWPNIPLKL